MRTRIKETILSMLVVCLCMASSSVFAQGNVETRDASKNEANAAEGGVLLNSENFPDNTFRAYISSMTGVPDGGTLSKELLQSVTKIDVSGSHDVNGNITTLKGIEYFTSLTGLYCVYNQLTSLDVSKNTELTLLSCDDNPLTGLDVSKNTALTSLSCSFNQLTSLDVSKNTALDTLICRCNQLSRLEVSNNTALRFLDCCGNQLASLNVSNNIALTYLDCGGNLLASLNVSKNIALEMLACYWNQLTYLDLSKNASLGRLECSYNQLSNLNLSKCTKLWELKCGNNKLSNIDLSKCTNLQVVYCDDNSLTSLDVTNCTSLFNLWCSNNKLKKLDLSTNKSLSGLSCDGNQLMCLDIPRYIYEYYLSWQTLCVTAYKIGKNQYGIPVPDGFNVYKLSNFKVDDVSVAPFLSDGYLVFSSPSAPKHISYYYICFYDSHSMGVKIDIADVDEMGNSNTVYMDDSELLAGTDAVLSIKMKNEVPIEGFEFDVYLPKDITVAVDEDGFPEVNLSTERTTARKTNSFDAVIREDGSIRVLAASTNGSAISGNDGEIVTVKVSIADDMIEGDYLVLLKNIALSGTDAKSYTNDMMVSTLTVNSYILGDANRDTQVNVGDFTATAHHILGNTPTQFNSKAADANQDYRIDVGDLTAIAHIILYGSVNIPNHAPSPRHLAASMTEAENTDNYVYIDPFNASTGAEYVVAVNMKNEVEAEGFEFDMYLPDGMSFVLDEDGFPEASLSTERTTARKTNNFDAVIQPDGALRVLAASSNGSTISGNDGEVALVKIKIDEGLAAGTYTLQLKNIVISDVDAVSHYTEERDAYATVVQGVATGVDVFDADAPTAGYYYNLNGQLVRRNATTDGLPAGVYIVNGKKVVVK